MVEACFQGSFGDWRGASGPGGDDDSPARRFSRFNCELLRESRRERKVELIAFVVVMALTIWPIVWMICSLIKVLRYGHLMPA